jgi:hypothetical protein
MTLVARKLNAAVVPANEEEAVDPFADVDDVFPQEGWQRQKEDKEDGLIKQVYCNFVAETSAIVDGFCPGACNIGLS